MILTEQNGFFKNHVEDFYGANGINKGCEFMHKHFDLFTADQIKDIYAHVLMKLKVETKSRVIYCGAEASEVIKLVEPCVEAAVYGFKNGFNVFDEIKLPISQLEGLNKPDFSPFVSTGPVRLSSMVGA